MNPPDVHVAVEMLGGGLGNVLFQTFMGYGMARRYGLDTFFMTTDYEDCNGRPHVLAYTDVVEALGATLGSHLEWRTKHVGVGNGTLVHSIEEGNAMYLPPYGNACGILFKGYWQSWRYVWPHRTDLAAALKAARPSAWASANARVGALREHKKIVAVHVRRGDYVKLADYHTVVSQDYYARALAVLGASPPGTARDYAVLLFTDDPEPAADAPYDPKTVATWPLWNAWKQAGAFQVSAAKDPMDVLFEMMACDAFALANSSLSLLAWLLAAGETPPKATAPAQWFGPKGPAFDIRDIVPTSCVTVLDA